MKLIPPIALTPAMLTSDVAITETAWTAGTYTLGTQRYVGVNLYEVVASPSTADEPTAGAAKAVPTWIKIGVINRWRMFDLIIAEATTQTAAPITVTIDPGETISGIALFNVQAASVRVVVNDPGEGDVYDRTNFLGSSTGLGDWYSYFFGTSVRDDTALFLDMPSYPMGVVTVTIEPQDGGDVSVGEMVVGKQRKIGTTLMNFTFGIEDFSRKERNEFGQFVIVERRFSKLATFDLFLTNSEVNNAFNTLAKYRATPIVYVGDEGRPETVFLGFYRDFSTLRTGPYSSEMSLEIEGLV
jgi:hypothetical protein